VEEVSEGKIGEDVMMENTQNEVYACGRCSTSETLVSIDIDVEFDRKRDLIVYRVFCANCDKDKVKQIKEEKARGILG